MNGVNDNTVPHFNETHGASHTRLYYAWVNMRNRCKYDSADHSGQYKGRGIGVCEEWSSFETFREWALANGYAEDLTIDRIDNDRDYSPENCRWATRLIQSRNRRNVLVLTAWGETKTLPEWADDPRAVVSRQTIWDRLQRGVNPEDAISGPRKKNQHA